MLGVSKVQYVIYFGDMSYTLYICIVYHVALGVLFFF